jgi:hypothetical protein
MIIKNKKKKSNLSIWKDYYINEDWQDDWIY